MPLSIGQVAARSGLPPKTIRYYEDIGVLAPSARRANGYRSYDESDLATLKFIARARSLGFSLDQVSELLALYHDKARPRERVRQLALKHLELLDRKLEELRSLRRAVADLADRCEGGSRPDCPILDEIGSGAGTTGQRRAAVMGKGDAL